jgi:hypothetical protein
MSDGSSKERQDAKTGDRVKGAATVIKKKELRIGVPIEETPL